jgi:hypothetical protein
MRLIVALYPDHNISQSVELVHASQSKGSPYTTYCNRHDS